MIKVGKNLKILGLVVVGVTIFSIFYYNAGVIDSIRVFVFLNLVPLDLVFDEGIDLKQYDASVIISCLHGGACPTGIKYKNDETGQIENRTVTTPMQQPYMPPEDPNAPPDPRTIPEPVQDLINKADTTVYIIFALFIIGLAIVFVLILKMKHKKK